MKIFVLTCFVLATTSAALLPATQERQRRDVSELQASADPAYAYLPPLQKLALPTEEAITELTTELPTTTEAASVKLSDKGYEYRTVRRLKYRYRTQRDVSHLAQHYLPPTMNYLPPAADDDSEVVAAPKLATEYLPPQEVASTEALAVAETEAPVPEVRSIEEEEEEAITEAAITEETPQDTAVLADDGYHYKQPEETPELKVASDYLPPLDDEAVEVVGPKESAVLADDGYHYRAIKRLRF